MAGDRGWPGAAAPTLRVQSLHGKDSLLHYLPRWLPLVAWGGAVFWLSLVPAPPVPKTGILGWDKFQHAAAYAIFTLLAFHSLSRSSDVRRRLVGAGITAVIFGGLMEVAQGVFTTTRTAEFGDLVADAVGAAVVCTLIALGRHLYKS